MTRSVALVRLFGGIAHLEGRRRLPHVGAVSQSRGASAGLCATHDAEAFFRSKLADIDEPTAPFGVMDVHGDGTQIEEA